MFRQVRGGSNRTSTHGQASHAIPEAHAIPELKEEAAQHHTRGEGIPTSIATARQKAWRCSKLSAICNPLSTASTDAFRRFIRCS